MSDWWSVLVDVESDVDDAAVDERIDDLLDVLEEHHASVGGARGGFGARISVQAGDAVEAGDRAAAVVYEASQKAGLAWGRVRRLEVVHERDFEDELAQPSFPAVLGTSEVTELLGVSRQRLARLRERPDFPEPMVELAAGPVWLRSAVAAFLERWDRRPGRPKVITIEDFEGIADSVEVELSEGDDMAKSSKSKPAIEVEPRPGGKWAVQKQGTERASKVTERKSDAVDAARAQARREKTELIVKDQQGRIQRRDSHV